MFTNEELESVSHFTNKIAYQGENIERVLSILENILSNAQVEFGEGSKEFKSIRKNAVQFCQAKSQKLLDFSGYLKEF